VIHYASTHHPIIRNHHWLASAESPSLLNTSATIRRHLQAFPEKKNLLSWLLAYLKGANSQAGDTHNVKEDFKKREKKGKKERKEKKRNHTVQMKFKQNHFGYHPA